MTELAPDDLDDYLGRYLPFNHPTDRDEAHRLGRVLGAIRGPWGRWVREALPIDAQGRSPPEVLDEASLERGRARRKAIWDWINQDGPCAPWNT